jgi:hypothetical protein
MDPRPAVTAASAREKRGDDVCESLLGNVVSVDDSIDEDDDDSSARPLPLRSVDLGFETDEA